jgi:hypothetical protein
MVFNYAERYLDVSRPIRKAWAAAAICAGAIALVMALKAAPFNVQAQSGVPIHAPTSVWQTFRSYVPRK